MSKPVIVCVDDEKFVLDTLRTTLSQTFGDDYLIEIAEDGPEALDLVRELLANGQEVPVIISDYVMPRMRGDELLQHIQIISQKTLKIMLTGQANIEGVTNAVNEADLYRFISKPWNNTQLVHVVQKAVKDYFLEKEKEDRSRALLDVTPDLVLFVRRDGLVLDYRHSAGQSDEPEEYSGRRLEDIFPQEIAAMFSEKIRELPVHGGCVSFEYHLKSGDLWRHFETRLTSCGKDAVLAVARDVSPSKDTEHALRAAIVEAEQANRAKSSFLAAMSHEIRTPLNAVVGFSSLMMDTPLDAEQREFADTIHRSADSLLSVVNDILDFSKIEAGRIDLEKSSFDLHEAVEDCLEMVAPEAHRKGIEICSLIDDKCPGHVIGDVTRLRQVLTNLLVNAVKFTERGEVDVSVEVVEPAGPAGVPVRFGVRDTGIGMSEDQQKKVFEPFIQADASTTRRFGGTGLGLAISGRLIELMGGSLHVVSRQREGSTFSFTIPLEPDPAAAASHPQEDLQHLLSGIRVAVVDDNATNRRYLGLRLKSWGAECLPFETGPAFLKFLEGGNRCDLILMDYHMPEMDGVAVAQALRGIPQLGQVPIVLLSSGGLDSLRFPAGLFARVFTKPANPRLLRNALALLAGTGKPESRSDLPGNMAAHHPLRILLAEDNRSNQKLLCHVLGHLGYQPSVASNGSEALEALRLQPYDVILMDIQMPELDGIQATKMIRAGFPAELQPAIIALTAHATEEDRLHCMEAGMDGYLTKPLRRNLLEETLRRTYERRCSGTQNTPISGFSER
jgi:signal transduction histidine kinase/CheY-like chemotaxis protein